MNRRGFLSTVAGLPLVLKLEAPSNSLQVVTEIADTEITVETISPLTIGNRLLTPEEVTREAARILEYFVRLDRI